ncbi:MAG TPA: hypothetical protein DD671_03535, partial [Balneolaceae bacterium]|nr:hypothetical protein [Balneolaceae bacterium]
KIFEVVSDFEPTIENGINFYATPEYQSEVLSLIGRLKKSGGDFEFEAKILSQKNTEKWIRVVGESFVVEGTTVKLFGTTQDITDKKDIELRLKQTNNRLTNVIEQSNNLYYEHDEDGKLTFISPQVREFLGFSGNDTELNWTDFITDHPKNAEGIEITEKTFRTGKPQAPYELQLKKQTGEYFWVLVNETPIVQDGKNNKIAGTLTDISEIKRTQNEVEKLSLVAQNTQNLVIIT